MQRLAISFVFAYVQSMNLVNKRDLAAALRVSASTIENKLRDGSLPGPVVGKWPLERCRPARAEERAYWDLDACLKAWGRPGVDASI